jgi:hypothetical protein
MFNIDQQLYLILPLFYTKFIVILGLFLKTNINTGDTISDRFIPEKNTNIINN